MKKIIKKIASLLLTIVILFSYAPISLVINAGDNENNISLVREKENIKEEKEEKEEKADKVEKTETIKEEKIEKTESLKEEEKADKLEAIDSLEIPSIYENIEKALESNIDEVEKENKELVDIEKIDKDNEIENKGISEEKNDILKIDENKDKKIRRKRDLSNFFEDNITPKTIRALTEKNEEGINFSDKIISSCSG